MKKSIVILFLILANLFWAGNYIFGKVRCDRTFPDSTNIHRDG